MNTSSMREVSEPEFWAAVKAEKRDVMPSSESDKSVWYLNGTRLVWGVSYPGYKNPRGEKRFYLS